MGNSLKAAAKLKAEHPLLPLQREEESDEEFTCDICIEPMVKKFRNGNRCSHPFCTDCMIQYIRFSLEHDNSGQIPCPDFNCGQKLDPHTWASTIGPTLFVRWCDVLAQDAVLKNAKSYCPNLNCNELILNECGGNPKKSKCPNCKNWFCFKCKRVWHEGYGCDEDDGDDVEVLRLAKKEKWRRCPKCKYFVERKDGCSLVRCRCGITFCYDCGKQLTRRNCYSISFCACPDSGLVLHDVQIPLAYRCCIWILLLFWVYSAFIILFIPLYGSR